MRLLCLGQAILRSHAVGKHIENGKRNDTVSPVCIGLFLLLALLSLATTVFGQETDPRLNAFMAVRLVAPFSVEQSTPPSAEPQQSSPSTNASGTDKAPENQRNKNEEAVPESKRQPKRILGVMPNYRAVSAGAIPPPPTVKQAFKIATQNSFDYSAFIFTGFTSGIADAEGAHKGLGDGVSQYWAYYWRGFVDKTDGNYLVIFALPTVFHQDERYYAMGKGSIGKRALYAATRVFITPDYHGHNSLNASELLGRAIAQRVSATYYPRADRTVGALATKWGYAVMRDSLTNVFREFWPDIATHVLHRHP